MAKSSAGKKWFRISLGLAVLLVALKFFQGCYLVEQAAYHLKNRFGQVSFAEAKADPDNAAYVPLLELIPQIRQFARDRIGLKDSSNYTAFLKVEGPAITYVATAAEPLALKPYLWWFPVVGDVPYKGYFEREEMEKELERLGGEGYDVWGFFASAYSSLGYFRDPVTTVMLRQGVFGLSETIIHEMVHATFYLAGETKFNETLASFVGKLGAERFVAGLPEGERLLRDKKNGEDDRNRFRKLMNEAYLHMDAVYRDPSASDDRKLEAKRAYLEGVQSKIRAIFPKASERFVTVNNARLLQFRRYDEENPVFEEVWREAGEDWTLFWRRIEEDASVLLAKVNEN